MKAKLISLFSITLFLFSCNNNPDTTTTTTTTTPVTPAIPVINYAYITSYPHDTTSFTEGFLFHNGILFESTGATSGLPQTRSLFGTVDLLTGKIDVKAELDKVKYFGEGITFLDGKIFQLTYQTKIGFVYDAVSFKKIKDFTFPSKEGWGMTTDGKNLIMSDGTNAITYLDPNSLLAVKTITVTENGYARENINELEYINSYLYANIWTTNTIVKIDTATGKVVGEMDLTSLADDSKNIFQGSMEMNGIAYDAASDKILVTGKMWPRIYEIKFNH